MRIDLYLHDALVEHSLEAIASKLNHIIQQGEHMSQQLDALRAEVERVKTVDQSVLLLIQGLADQIRDAKDDPIAIQALADDLRAQTDSLAAAVAANTPPTT